MFKRPGEISQIKKVTHKKSQVILLELVTYFISYIGIWLVFSWLKFMQYDLFFCLGWTFWFERFLQVFSSTNKKTIFLKAKSTFSATLLLCYNFYLPSSSILQYLYVKIMLKKKLKPKFPKNRKGVISLHT